MSKWATTIFLHQHGRITLDITPEWWSAPYALLDGETVLRVLRERLTAGSGMLRGAVKGVAIGFDRVTIDMAMVSSTTNEPGSFTVDDYEKERIGIVEALDALGGEKPHRRALLELRLGWEEVEMRWGKEKAEDP